jgi:hypothetical protein
MFASAQDFARAAAQAARTAEVEAAHAARTVRMDAETQVLRSAPRAKVLMPCYCDSAFHPKGC